MSVPDAAAFATHLNQCFQLWTSPSESIEAELVEVTQHEERTEAGKRSLRSDPFALVFRCEKPEVLPQGMYKLEHEALGTLDLFLVPIGPDDKGLCYEAVFN